VDFSFRQLAPIEHARGQVVFGGEIFQHICARGIGAGLALLAAFKAHLRQTGFRPSCLGEPTLKLLAREFVNLCLEAPPFSGRRRWTCG
jgi:hypothetical protein